MLCLLCVCALFATAAAAKGEPSEPLEPVVCYAKCVARCMLNTTSSFGHCINQCSRYTFTEPCPTDDNKCWKDAVDIICPEEVNNTDSAPRHEPLDLTVKYVRDPYEQPYLVELEWTPVQYAQLYLVQVKDMEDRFSPFTQTSPDYVLLFQEAKAQIDKSRLCPTYGFRVAAVNHLGVSGFSDVVTIKAPRPELNDFSYEVAELRAVDRPYIVDEHKAQTNRTIIIGVRMTLPANWNANDLIGVESHLVWIACKSKVNDNAVIVMHKTMTAMNESRVTIAIPEIRWDVPCKVMFRLEKLESICGTVYEYPTLLPDTGYPGLLIVLNCETVIDSGCDNKQLAPPPLCTTDEFSYEAISVGNESALVNLNVSWSMGATKAPILYYAIEVHELEERPNNSNTFHVAQSIRKVFQYRTCSQEPISGRLHKFQNSTTNLLIPNLRIGRRYGVYICGLFDAKSEKAIEWNITARREVNLREESPHRKRIAQENGSTAAAAAMTVASSCAVAVALLVAVAAVAYRWRSASAKRAKRKTLHQLAATAAAADNDHRNPYVVQPRRGDHWEVGRERVEIDYEQKLGAGAFGAVYKGKLTGRLVGSKLSNSPVAENWTKAEDCYVAVKMLPEYADDSAKSDFRKEINLMKRLGYHEKLVNMLACITVDEPLCLIVEYCSDGDLLHYLRDRRRYMLKLEQCGVDIRNAEENADIDFNMTLCLKDLLSFSWQICVGLEFLSQKGYVHRDVAARNVLVDNGKRAKIGDFGLCRFICSDTAYMGKGGRLPVKWMAPEAIKNYEFTTKSDVWSFGILLFEIITLGGSPYPGIQPSDIEQILDDGKRMEQPTNCPDDLYKVMLYCWQMDADQRPTFSAIRENLRAMLELITEDYDYTGLSRDYYNVVISDDDQEDREEETNGDAS